MFIKKASQFVPSFNIYRAQFHLEVAKGDRADDLLTKVIKFRFN